MTVRLSPEAKVKEVKPFHRWDWTDRMQWCRSLLPLCWRIPVANQKHPARSANHSRSRLGPRLQEVGVKYSVLLWPANRPTAHIGMVEDKSSDAHPSAFLSVTQVHYQAEWSHQDVPA